MLKQIQTFFALSGVVKLLLWINVPFTVSYELFFPFLALYIKGLDATAMILSFSAILVFYNVSNIILAGAFLWLAHKFSLYWLIIISCVFRALSWILLIWVDNLVQLCVVMLLLSISHSLYVPGFAILFTKKIGGHTTDSIDMKNFIDHIVIAVGAGIGGLVANYFGFNGVFIISALLTAVSLIGFVWLKNKEASLITAPSQPY